MNYFSYVIIFFSLLNILCAKSKRNILIYQTSLTLFVCSFVDVGYFIESDIINVDYYQAVIVIQFIMSLFIDNKKVKLSKSFLLYISSLIISTLLLLVFPSKTANAMDLSNPRFENYMTGHFAFVRPFFSKYTVFFLILALCLSFIINKLRCYFSIEEWGKVLCVIAKLGKFQMIIVFIEFFIKYIMRSNAYSSFIITFFGRGTSTYLTLENRGIFVMMQGLTREGSHFAYAMMLLVIIFYTTGIIEKKNNSLWIALAIVAMVLSGALMMLVCSVTLCGYYLIIAFSKELNKTKKRVAVVVMTVSLVLFAMVLIGHKLFTSDGYLASRLADAVGIFMGVGNKNVAYYATLSHVTSNQSRLFSLVYAIREWIKRPLWGIGIGTTFAYSSTLLTLAETGIVTMLAIVNFYLDVIRKYGVDKKMAQLVIGLWLVCNAFSGIQSRLIVAADVMVILGSCIAAFGSKGLLNQDPHAEVVRS